MKNRNEYIAVAQWHFGNRTNLGGIVQRQRKKPRRLSYEVKYIAVLGLVVVVCHLMVSWFR